MKKIYYDMIYNLLDLFLVLISLGMETEKSIAFINDSFECTLCGRGFPHIQTVHTGDQKVLCHVCNKLLKNKASLKTHLRGAHGIYQGGKSGNVNCFNCFQVLK